MARRNPENTPGQDPQLPTEATAKPSKKKPQKRITWKAEIAARKAAAGATKKTSGYIPALIGKSAQVKLISFLAIGSTIGKACDEAQVARRSYYRTRDYDEEFAKLCDDAIENGTDRLEEAATKRGCDGVQRPVFQGGKLVGHVQEYSDTLLIALLNARRPERFKWRGDLTSDGKEINRSLVDTISKAGVPRDRSADPIQPPTQVLPR